MGEVGGRREMWSSRKLGKEDKEEEKDEEDRGGGGEEG